MRPWQTLKSRYLIERWWMNLRVDHVRLPDGHELEEYHVIEYPDWTCVVCLDDAGRLVMVEQYRYGIQRASLEFPAGAVDPGEDPIVCARRELREETGYEAEDWQFLGRCAPDPTRHTNYAHLYVARAARRVQSPSLDDGEDIAVRLLDPAEVLRRADAGELLHGMHLTALFWAAHRGWL